MYAFDCVVVGAGVVGLAIARSLSRAGHAVVVLEAAPTIGSGVSSRNSEVIHAGMYYAAGSLKARLCVEGRRQLYAYCETRGVPFRRLGKLIVSTRPTQDATLQSILTRAEANGVEDLTWLDARQAKQMEPALSCTGALWSQQTGIVDSHALMAALRDDVEALGGLVVVDTPLRGGAYHDSTWTIETGGRDPVPIACSWLINAAGLHAQTVAASLDGFPTPHIPKLVLARGCYFALEGSSPFSRLIYPVPMDGGLGIHLTLDLGGQARFGPDVEWIESVDYTVDPTRGDTFYESIREYWPGLPDDSLRPSFAGVRPKLSGRGEPARDFAVHGPAEHGVDGVVNLFGIESPGLTAALALGDYVTALVTRGRT